MPRNVAKSAKISLTLLLALVLTAPLGAATHRAGHGGGGDGTYEQPVWFEWSITTLDVFVIPPEHGQIYNGNGVLDGLSPAEATPCDNSYMRATVDSINGWAAGIAAYGSPALQGVAINVYTPGCGGPTPPLAAILDPEIIVASDQNKAVILGVAVTLGPACIVDNSKFFVTSFTYADMYNINGQEYGHCLGLDHTSGPDHDVMDGEYDDDPGAAGTHLHCVSNLNVAGLERVFGFASGTASVSSGSYARIAC